MTESVDTRQPSLLKGVTVEQLLLRDKRITKEERKEILRRIGEIILTEKKQHG